MTSLVTGYSSEEEDDENYESTSKMTKSNGQMQRQKDVNYDDVKMDMSDESDREKDEKRKSDSEVSNTEDNKAYQKQFNHSEESTARSKDKSSDEDRRSPHSKHSKHDDRHRSSHRHHRRHREDRSRHDGDRHRRKHRRRSRSRDHRRSRSRERSRSSRDEPEYDRMSKHSRKLKALGLVGQKSNEEDGEASVPESSSKKFSPGSASGLLINEGIVKKQVEAQVAQVKQITGVELPKYYNPTAINPLRYADQIKKRKLLWSKPASSCATEDKPSVENERNGSGNNNRGKDGNAKHESGNQSSSYNNWESTNFGNSQANEKFRRLMGIKTTSVPSANSGNEGPANQKMFQDLDKQYEKARMTTHTARGLGLGFSNPPIPMSSSVGAIDDNAKLSKK